MTSSKRSLDFGMRTLIKREKVQGPFINYVYFDQIGMRNFKYTVILKIQDSQKSNMREKRKCLLIYSTNEAVKSAKAVQVKNFTYAVENCKQRALVFDCCETKQCKKHL